MNFILPFLYILILALILVFIFSFIIGQILFRRNTDLELVTIQDKIRNVAANGRDYYQLGVIFLSKKLYDQAIINFRYALNLWELEDTFGLVNLYNTIGFTYTQTFQYELALFYYQKALFHEPSYLVTLKNVGFVYEKTNDLIKAKETYLQILKYDMDNKFAIEKLNSLDNRLNRDDRI